MPTEREKQAEKDRVTRISGFRVGYHDFLAEVDLDALKRRNDRWEAEHRHQSLLDRKTEELIRIAAYVAMRNPPHHIQIHVHSAHKAGATPEEIYQVIDNVGGWAGGAARQNGMEAWRLVFRPDLPTIERVVELTDDSFGRGGEQAERVATRRSWMRPLAEYWFSRPVRHDARADAGWEASTGYRNRRSSCKRVRRRSSAAPGGRSPRADWSLPFTPLHMTVLPTTVWDDRDESLHPGATSAASESASER